MSWRTILHRNAKTVWVISGFHREADENGALPGCYAASTGNLLPTFRAILSGPIIRGQESKKKNSWLPEDETDRSSRNVLTNYRCSLCNIPEEYNSIILSYQNSRLKWIHFFSEVFYKSLLKKKIAWVFELNSLT